MAVITAVTVQTFEDNVRHLAQQKGSKLRAFCQERGNTSEDHNWDRLAAGEAADKTLRFQDTAGTEGDWSRRIATVAPFDMDRFTEMEDPSVMLIDPNSEYVKSIGMGMGRKWDDRIITASTATANTESGGTSVYPWATQSAGAYTVPFNFELVTGVQRRFMDNDIDPSEPKVAIVGPAEVEAALKLTEQTSSDYVHREALQQLNASGIVANWLGFTWVMSTRLQNGGDTGGGAGTRDCLFMTESALGTNVAMDITTKVAQAPSKRFAWIMYASANMGVVRVEDEHIVVGKVLSA